MAKPKRRQQQHLRQEQSRKRSYSIGSTAPKEIYKPGFPMNLLGNLKFFSIVGIAATAVMVLAAAWAAAATRRTARWTFPQRLPHRARP